MIDFWRILKSERISIVTVRMKILYNLLYKGIIISRLSSYLTYLATLGYSVSKKAISFYFLL